MSSVQFCISSAKHREVLRTMVLLKREHAAGQRQVQAMKQVVHQRERDSRKTAEACQSALCKLQETEQELHELQRRCEVLARGREQIESEARLALARSMVAASSRRLAAQPAESLLLAERAMTYLGDHGETIGPELQQTLRDSMVLTGDQAFRGHSGPVEAIAVSSNGRWLVTGSTDNTARLWDLHAPIPHDDSRILRGHQSRVHLAEISPDSRWAVTASDNGRIIVWDLESPDPSNSSRALSAHHGRIHDLAISSDSRWLAAGGAGTFEEKDNTVRLWDLHKLARAGLDEPLAHGQAGEKPREDGMRPYVLRGHLGPVLAVAITPDCRWVVTGSDDETVRLFDLTSHCPAASQIVLRQHSGPVTSIAISPDGRWMVTGSNDRTARLWDLTTPQPGSRSTVLQGHEGWVHSVAINSTGRWVATAAYDKTVRLWNMNAIDPAASCVILSGHQADVGPILFTPDGRQLLTGSDDGTARVWNVESADPTSDPIVFNGHCGPIGALAVTPDGRKVLSGCRQKADGTDCLVRLWDLPIEDVLDKARPIIVSRMNANEQEHVLLETARRLNDRQSQ